MQGTMIFDHRLIKLRDADVKLINNIAQVVTNGILRNDKTNIYSILNA